MALQPKLYTVPAAIRSLRLSKAWDRSDLADKAGLSVGLLAMIEVRERSVEPETVRRLASALGCKPSEISVVKQAVDGLYSERHPGVAQGSK